MGCNDKVRGGSTKKEPDNAELSAKRPQTFCGATAVTAAWPNLPRICCYLCVCVRTSPHRPSLHYPTRTCSLGANSVKASIRLDSSAVSRLPSASAFCTSQAKDCRRLMGSVNAIITEL